MANIINAPTINAPPVYTRFSVLSVRGLPLTASRPNNVSWPPSVQVLAINLEHPG